MLSLENISVPCVWWWWWLGCGRHCFGSRSSLAPICPTKAVSNIRQSSLSHTRGLSIWFPVGSHRHTQTPQMCFIPKCQLHVYLLACYLLHEEFLIFVFYKSIQRTPLGSRTHPAFRMLSRPSKMLAKLEMLQIRFGGYGNRDKPLIQHCVHLST